MEREGILVVNLGGQYAHLEADRVRRFDVFSELVDPEDVMKHIDKAKGIILSGGPFSVYEKDAPIINPIIYNSGIPILGICYGHQLIAYDLGGKVKPGLAREYGRAELKILRRNKIFKGWNDSEVVWMSHGDSIEELPPGSLVLGMTDREKCAAITIPEKKIYSVQFHPELTQTLKGMQLFENFIFDVCGCQRNFTMETYANEQILDLRKKLKGKQVMVQCSGGVDSTVTVMLTSKAIGFNNVHIVHLNAFLRKNESHEVLELLYNIGFRNIYKIDAEDEILNSNIVIDSFSKEPFSRKRIEAIEDVKKKDPTLKYEFEFKDGKYVSKPLNHVVHPEVQRWIIGDKMIEITDREIRSRHLPPNIVIGTLYPDHIESGSVIYSDVIKSHHNRVPIIMERRKSGLVHEPLLWLYKDQVRKLARTLGLPEKLARRHPFPGPGRTVRTLCADDYIAPSIEKLEALDRELNRITSRFNLSSLALPLKSVGVQGDSRTFALCAALIGDASYETFGKTRESITSLVPDINRVVHLLCPERIDSAELIVPSYLSKERLDLGREADYVVMQTMEENNLMDSVYQFPVILAPLSINGGGESVVLRPIESMEAMSASFAKLNRKVVKQITERLLDIKGIDAVFYDVTDKPPASIEWL